MRDARTGHDEFRMGSEVAYLLMADEAVDAARVASSILATPRGPALTADTRTVRPAARRGCAELIQRFKSVQGPLKLTTVVRVAQSANPENTMTMTDPRATRTIDAPFAELDARTTGIVAVPGDEAYNRLVSPWNIAIPVKTVAVVDASPRSIVEAVRFAASHDLR